MKKGSLDLVCKPSDYNNLHPRKKSSNDLRVLSVKTAKEKVGEQSGSYHIMTIKPNVAARRTFDWRSKRRTAAMESECQ